MDEEVEPNVEVLGEVAVGVVPVDGAVVWTSVVTTVVSGSVVNECVVKTVVEAVATALGHPSSEQDTILQSASPAWKAQ